MARVTAKKPSIKKETKPAKTVKAASLRAKKLSGGAAQAESIKHAGESKASLSVPVLGVDGKSAGRMSLPGELFGVKVPKTLLAQSVRVYLANQREGSAKTKTRGEVEGSTKKIYRQKGTGRARHGGIRAPIFVGGGITFGPLPQDHSLGMPTKMRRLALCGALSERLAEGSLIFVDGLDTVSKKTKTMDQALTAAGKISRTLLVVDPESPMVVRAARNIDDIDIIPANGVHAYGILTHKKIMIMKSAVSVLKHTFIK